MRRAQFSRILLGVLAVTSLWIGIWAGFFPRSFYADFPGTSHPWVSPDGPFNEHLVRDVGWFNLAIALVLVVAAFTLTRAAVGAAAGAVLVSGVPHLAYHVAHLDLYATADQIGNVVSLAAGPITALIVLGLTFWPSPGGVSSTRSPGGNGAKIRESTPTPLSSTSTT